MSTARYSVHVRIEGRVQGVSFRAKTAERARSFGVCGWVRNLPEGSVEAHFEGQKEAVEALLKWCEIGSPRAKVDALTWSEIDPEHIIHFEVRR